MSLLFTAHYNPQWGISIPLVIAPDASTVTIPVKSEASMGELAFRASAPVVRFRIPAPPTSSLVIPVRPVAAVNVTLTRTYVARTLFP